MQIPVDMVVNSMIAAMVVNANKSSGTIYQVGSSLRNPIKFYAIRSFAFQFFAKFPWINKDGNPILVGLIPIFKTMATFHMYMKIRYMLPLKVCRPSHLRYYNVRKVCCSLPC